ncbi:MAG TPA: hypothetical protein VGE74_12600 [Gemmata sp.]
MDASYFRHESTGCVQYDPGTGTRAFEPWWLILVCDRGIVDYYAWLLLRYGIEIHKGSTFGPHISVVKGVEPPAREAWGFDPGPITFRYTNVVRWDNGRHAWLDVWAPELARLRAGLGFSTPEKVSFHLTLGRLVFPHEGTRGGAVGEPGGLVL